MKRANATNVQRLHVCFGILVLLSISSCAGTRPAQDDHSTHAAVHWGYEVGDGPQQWSSMDPAWALCAQGVAQSPIDLTNAAPIELQDVVIDTPSESEVAVRNQRGVVDALDNGHTIQINTKDGATLTVGAKTYALVQFHFHAPSEHTLDGRHLPMEMHFVHQAQDGALAVLGVLVEQGGENLGIAPLWAQLTEAAGTETKIRVPKAYADQLFIGEESGMYHYKGSLTTPPCSEGVQWYIRKTPTQLSKEQIAAFTAVYNHNNRPVQPLGDRSLYLDASPNVTID
jgi:carbonic anhydrase